MADTQAPLSGTPSGTQFGIPMVKVAQSGSEVMAGITVDQANALLAMANMDNLTMRKMMVASGMVGTIAAWPTNGANAAGWASCQGTAVSRTTFSLLFAVIGGTFGIGDGSTTFNLPDLKGRTIAGYPTGGRLGLSGFPLVDSVGRVGGDDTHTQIISELATHNHSHSHAPNGGGGFIRNIAGSGTVVGNAAGTAWGGVATTDVDATPAGSSVPFNIVQPTILMQWMIFYGYGT